jgi:uncharacterized membrane protein (UPF0127 family)
MRYCCARRGARPGRTGISPVAGRSVASALVALLALASATGVSAQEANPTLQRTTLTAGIHRISAEVADSPQSRQRGLMMRQRLGPNEGMLFVFEDAAVHCFWMKNTPLPLSIAFIDDQGTVVNVADMAPRSEDSHCPRKPIRYALEMEQGWFGQKGVGPGDRIGGLR